MLVRIAVFDSGFGSLSIIKSIRRHTKAEIIYFADQKNYPYGKKTKRELEVIIKNTIKNLQKNFSPDLIVVGSNTPSLLIRRIFSDSSRVIGVLPPIKQAQQVTKINSIALLVTNTVSKSNELRIFLKNNLSKDVKTTIIDSSDLVDLVESGAFIHNKKFCLNKIISILKLQFEKNNIDVATLSSTHLPFLLPFFEKIFPQIHFLDPADLVVKQIIKNKHFHPSKNNSLKIFTSGNKLQQFQNDLAQLGIKKKIHPINFL